MVIETTSFHLAEGVDEAAFVDTDGHIQTDVFYAQPGLLRRTTARAEDGEWITIAIWASTEEADAAAPEVGSHALAASLRSMLDEGTIRHHRYTTLD